MIRIDTTATPIVITTRKGKGVTLRQGGSRVMLAPNEIRALIDALDGIAPADGRPTIPIPAASAAHGRP